MNISNNDGDIINWINDIDEFEKRFNINVKSNIPSFIKYSILYSLKFNRYYFIVDILCWFASFAIFPKCGILFDSIENILGAFLLGFLISAFISHTIAIILEYIKHIIPILIKMPNDDAQNYLHDDSDLYTTLLSSYYAGMHNDTRTIYNDLLALRTYLGFEAEKARVFTKISLPFICICIIAMIVLKLN